MIPALVSLAGSAMSAMGAASSGPKVSSASAANTLGQEFGTNWTVSTGGGSARGSSAGLAGMDSTTLMVIALVGYFLWKHK